MDNLGSVKKCFSFIANDEQEEKRNDNGRFN